MLSFFFTTFCGINDCKILQLPARGLSLPAMACAMAKLEGHAPNPHLTNGKKSLFWGALKNKKPRNLYEFEVLPARHAGLILFD
jgi:hypothetical protein